MQLFVKGSSLHVYEATETSTLAEVRDFACSAEGVSCDEIRLYANGSPLDNDALAVSDLTGTTIECNVVLLGGKVHGSLSRAGKVKGQTPKVERQEKKKAKTGRAKRRIQYNRRFVQNVQGFGKKRGPNSNSA